MWFCGIDWAEKHLDFCLETESSDVVKRHRVDNNEDGFFQCLIPFQRSISTPTRLPLPGNPHTSWWSIFSWLGGLPCIRKIRRR